MPAATDTLATIFLWTISHPHHGLRATIAGHFLTSSLSHVARAHRQAKHVKSLFLEELGPQMRQRVCRLPPHPLWLYQAKVVCARVMRIHDEESCVTRLFVEIDAEQCEGQLAAPDHDRRPFRVKMMRQLPTTAWHVIAAVEDLRLARDA
eukprot:CAMPEP_0174725058 /NCGR_PEP_ID=MMETSP1094-20130205/44724_1 /TAXON_ID=156173 /ORGANISM="Chrysochromulina brevifilum, Strain UTEX LB 985" /LENGTH=149 /DNA_ID=CAMNT_0015926377 /DNA_START=81 /DNA_END=526 /DNA_ORIENTATION=-